MDDAACGQVAQAGKDLGHQAARLALGERLRKEREGAQECLQSSDHRTLLFNPVNLGHQAAGLALGDRLREGRAVIILA